MAGPELYIGLISGTSADAIDAALIDTASGTPRLLATHSQPLEASTRATIHQLAHPGDNEIDRLGALDRTLGDAFGRAALGLLEQNDTPPTKVIAIGSHGQTLRHRPPGKEPVPGGFSLQVADPNRIAQHTGITTVADFRRRDMAAAGQGAPLVPALHCALFQQPGQNRAVVNIGGVANLTWLSATGAVIGFDTGPGNNLMDAWTQRHLGQAFDNDGSWGRSGRADPSLLARLLQHPYFRQPPPKSTGPETFHLRWLDECIASLADSIAPADVQATLLRLTATGITQAIESVGSERPEALYLCGGGAHNHSLRAELTTQLHGTVIEDTGALGLDPDWVEAVAFAWLAHQTLNGLPGNLPDVTGANEPVVLGGIYPGRRGLTVRPGGSD